MTDIIAHRARGSLSTCENTIESMQLLGSWVDGVEIDLQLTSDDIPVLLHDDTVDRTTDGTGAISSMTAATATALLVDHEAAGQGNLPTLADFLAAVEGLTWVYLDTKHTDVTSLALFMAVVDAAPQAAQDAVIWLCPDETTTANVRSVSGTARIARRGANTANISDIIAEMDAVDGELITTNPDTYPGNRDLVGVVHDAGYLMGAGRLNDLDELWAARLDGCDNVATDISDQMSHWGPQPPPPVYTSEAITEIISGSHQVVYEATLLESFQIGPEPVGDTLLISSGDVAWDATADVWSSMSIQTPGLADDIPQFPRFPTDPLAPYGTEVYLRYGIDAGPEILWTPLGYYRIDSTDQPDDIHGPITLAGNDRMQGLIDARLIEPRQYKSHRTIATMVYDLVLDVFPDAVIIWDDDDEQLPLGRTIVVEEDRYAALRDVAASRGKVVYWDSEGILRFEAAPDPEDIAWEMKSGSDGVLVKSSRSLSREGMYNGVVARSSGTTEAPAVGIMVDTGAASPTRWGGRFGKVPRFYASPLIKNNVDARSAAESILRRSIGMPKSVDFGTVPNPTLRPRQATRIATRDGNRERHLVETLRLPLQAGQTMTGTTKEQSLISIGSLLPTEIAATAGIEGGE